MEFLVNPKPMYGERLYTDVIGTDSKAGTFTVYWELRTRNKGWAIDRGNKTMPIEYLPLFAVVKPNEGMHVQDDATIRAQVAALLADPDIDMTLPDYVADTEGGA